MAVARNIIDQLVSIADVSVREGVPLAEHTRFAIGGPAAVFAEAATERALADALHVIKATGAPYTVIGEGSNLIVSDDGFDGIVLRFTARDIARTDDSVRADAGATLQTLVDYAIAQGLRGLETMTGIPGSVGAAVYGNAGAYGHSIHERVSEVRFLDRNTIRSFNRAECQFRYRESVFKERKSWIILSVDLDLTPAPSAELRATADEILKIRLAKYPTTMKCAGSIFKNLLIADLPESVRTQIPERVVREGKVPSAYFLEQAGAKGLRNGGVEVAEYHANLIYNTGAGTAAQLRELIDDLKARVRAQFAIELEEEVQYVGFAPSAVLS